jgi:hypothetical protein
MKWRAKWSHVAIALAVIAALAIASPVFGLSKSLKKAIRNEVSRQIGKAAGPTGPPGPTGGKGAEGTARAYAKVFPPDVLPCILPGSGCHFERSKGVTSVTRMSAGSYCVTAPGISAELGPDAVAPVVSVDFSNTASPAGNASAMIDFESTCNEAFHVLTQRQPSTAVRNAADTGSINVAGNAVAADDVGFTIVIP